jgi:enamine deaminase RidA (YjgF/YER057c/UK114 family)
MALRRIAAALLALCPAALADHSAGQDAAKPLIQYIPLDAPAGMSQAVIVQNSPLVHTRQLLPVDTAGKLVGEGSADLQIEQVLNNLEAVLKDSGSGLNRLVRLNVYAISPATVTRVRELLGKRLDPAVRPAITSVLTPMPRRNVLVALDAVAAAADSGKSVALKRCEAVAGEKGCADAAILPCGGVAYLSGQPDEAELTEFATTRSMSNLMKTLAYLKLSPAQVVQIKVFLRPITSADEVLREVQQFFPGQATPPVVFVEWLAAVPIEIEMIAALPPSGTVPLDQAAEDLTFVTPPEYRPSIVFSKVALVRAPRQIYISGQYARAPSRGEPQSKYVFGQLQEILSQTGSDMRHLAKATYYVSDHDAARWVDRTRPAVLDPDRPPAASKVMVHAVGMEGRTMTIDIIAVGRGR